MLTVLDGSESNPVVCLGAAVEVYRNLNRKCWSVRRGGRVAFHAESLLLGGATFHVSEAGRARVLRERRKNVHAVVRGQLLAAPEIPLVPAWVWLGKRWITYNPYQAATFTSDAGLPVAAAYLVRFGADGRVQAMGVE